MHLLLREMSPAEHGREASTLALISHIKKNVAWEEQTSFHVKCFHHRAM